MVAKTLLFCFCSTYAESISRVRVLLELLHYVWVIDELISLHLLDLNVRCGGVAAGLDASMRQDTQVMNALAQHTRLGPDVRIQRFIGLRRQIQE